MTLLKEPVEVWWLASNIIGWMILGGIAGFIYAWRRVGIGQRSGDGSVEQMELDDESGDLAGRPMGYRFGAGYTFAAVGAIAGACIWAIASAALLIFTSP